MASKLKRMAFNLPQQELDRLSAYSEKTGRTKTDILRELIRTLPEPDPKPESKKK
jgi:predicted DNA-binding protein